MGRATAQQPTATPQHPPLTPQHPPLTPQHPPLTPQHPPLAPQHPSASPSAPPRVAPSAADPLAAERAKAERLARIIVSDIVLYNPEKFAAALRTASPVDAMRDELEEGRALFRDRIDARVRGERDHLADELDRVAQTRGVK